MKTVYTQNPLRSYVEMNEEEKIELKEKLYHHWLVEWDEPEDSARKWTEHQYPYMLDALTLGEEHFGDCIKVCGSCVKCQAEDVLGINTTEGLGSLYYISAAFSDGRETIEEAISYLSIPIESHEEWHEPRIDMWNQQRLSALNGLIKYRIKHFDIVIQED